MGKKDKKASGEGKGTDIRPLFVSLNLILLVFFVYINSIAKEDEARTKKALDSLLGTFSVLSGGMKMEEGKTISAPGPPLGAPDAKSTIKLSQELGAMVEKIDAMIEEQHLQEKIKVSGRGVDLVIHMDDAALFSTGSAELHDSAARLLEAMAPILKESPHPIRVEGHTDDQPISTERYPSNWELSAARAVSVLRFLSERREIPRDRLTAVGYGEYRPLVPNDTPEQQAKNRRVNIVLLGGGERDGQEK